ncbi:hypothetical protein [Metabacillus sp. RGM 3146]|uniref:hypothetical protein n=1 Tax=Metabacillus sp. RGM 3146 TaxID=3401092 RepID=UPI003B9A36EC
MIIRQQAGIVKPVKVYHADNQFIGSFSEKLAVGLKREVEGENQRMIAAIQSDIYLYDVQVTGENGEYWRRFREGWLPVGMVKPIQRSQSVYAHSFGKHQYASKVIDACHQFLYSVSQKITRPMSRVTRCYLLKIL